MSESVFISHSSANFIRVKEIADYLEQNGIKTWYSERDIPAGSTYTEEIIKVIKNEMSIMIVYVTEDISNSKYVPKEVERAVHYSKRIIPVYETRIDMPESLEFLAGAAQLVEISQVGLEGLVQSLVEAIELSKEEGKEEKALPKPVNQTAIDSGIAYLLADEKINGLNKLFVPPPQFVNLDANLQKNHILILWNEYRVGKYTSAIQLLKNQKVNKIYELSADITWEKFTNIPFERNSGYILQISNEIALWKIQEMQIRSLLQRLKEVNSFVCIVTVANPKNEHISDFIEKIEAPSDPLDLIKNHYFAQYDKFIDKETLNELRINLPTKMLPADAISLLTNIKEYESGNILIDQVYESIDSVAAERIQKWFETHSEIFDMTMLLTISMFEGENYSTLKTEQNKIFKLFGGEPEDSAFPINLDEWLKKYYATNVKVSFVTDIGTEEKDGIFLQYEEDHKHIWKFFWTRIDNHLKDSLIDIILNNLSYKKRRKATFFILNELMRIDFGYIRTNVLHQLIRSERSEKQFTAIRLIEQYVRTTENYGRVWNLLKSWAGIENHSFRKVSLQLMAGPVGNVYLLQSIEKIPSIINQDSKCLYVGVETMRSLIRKLENDPDLISSVFSFITNWLKNEAINSKSPEYGKRFIERLVILEPAIFYMSIETYYKKLWLPFFNDIYSDVTNNQILNKLIEQIYRNESNSKKLVAFLQYFIKFASPTAVARLKNYLKDRKLDDVLL